MKKLILVLLALVSTGAEAKLSSTKIKKQSENIEAVLKNCVFDKSSLNDIKSKSVGTAITSGVATVVSGVGATTSTMAALKAGKIINNSGDNIAISSGDDKDTNTINEKNNAKLKNLRLASTIASGVATGANLASVALSASSTTSLASLMDKAEDCNSALSAVEISE